MEMKVWMIIIYSLVALCHCAPAQDDNAERAKRGCSSPKAKPGAVYYEGCTKFECKKKRKAFVWVQTLDSGVCCIVENKGFPVGSVIFTNSTADNCTISTLTCRNNGDLPSLVYQYKDNQCNNEELLEALEMIKKEMGRMEMNSNHTEELLVEHANHTAELLEGHDNHTEELLEALEIIKQEMGRMEMNSNHTEELLVEHSNHTEELLEALEIIKQEMGRMEMNSNHTEELLVEHSNHTAELLEENANLTEDALEIMTMEMETIKTMLNILLPKAGCGPGDVTFVSGNQHSYKTPLENILTHDKVETYNHYISPASNYWSWPRGVPGTFILNLGCIVRFATIKLVNTHNSAWRDRSTRKFRLLTGLTQHGPWTQVLETELEDSTQQQDPLPLQRIALDRSTFAQFVKFQGISYWGHGGGLQYFDIQRNNFCDQGDAAVVSGNTFHGNFPAENILTHDKVEKVENGNWNIWLSPRYGALGTFILYIGCEMTFSAIQLVNTHHNDHHGATRQFRLLTGLTLSGPWTQVLESQELEDSTQQQDPLPLQLIALDRTTTAQYVKFEEISHWGSGGGLQFFDIVRN